MSKARTSLQALKRKAGESLVAAADLCGIVFAGSGAAVVAVLGRFMLAALLGAIALGFFLRFANRKRLQATQSSTPPAWSRVIAAMASAVVVAVLVEATDFPVRFHQPGFELWHWLLVVAALSLAYALFIRVMRSLVGQQEKRAW